MNKFFWVLFWFCASTYTMWVQLTQWEHHSPVASAFLAVMTFGELVCLLLVTLGAFAGSDRNARARLEAYERKYNRQVQES